MPNDVVGDIVRVTVACMQPDSQVQMVNISFRCSVAGAGDTRIGLGNVVFNKFTTNWLPILAPASKLYGWKVSSMNKVPAYQPVWNSAVAVIGTGTNPPAPTQARPILRFSTASAGRKYRGRIFLFTPGTNQCDVTGYPTAGCNAATTALAVSLILPIVTGGSTWVPVIAHRVKGSPSATTTTDIAGQGAPGLFGTQRRSGNTGRLNPVPW